MNQHWNRIVAQRIQASRVLALLLAVLLAAAGGASAGQKKKKKGGKNSDDSSVVMPPLPVPDEIDLNIGKMLGAWQIGDVEGMHKYYADNVSFVSGSYDPPVIGWQNYVAAYQLQRARIHGMQFVRRNTHVFLKDNTAWACYQWEFDAMVDGKPMSVRGQTTLVFIHANDQWLIVHNHTSQICEQIPQSAAGTGTPPEAPQPTPHTP